MGLFSLSREGKRRGLLWKTLVGLSVGVPVALGVQYAVSDPREKRKMRIVIEGFGRFCRFVFIFVPLFFLNNNHNHHQQCPR